MFRAAEVLAHFPAPVHGPITPFASRDGFSGALLFRIGATSGDLCMRGWPGDTAAAHVGFVHGLMNRAADAGLPFVPRLLQTTRGDPAVAVAGQWWDLTTWMPGTPLLCTEPTPDRVRAASKTLAQLHRAWADPHPPQTPPPAVARRLAAARDWLPLIAAGWQPPRAGDDPIGAPAHDAWMILRRRLPQLPTELTPWLGRPMALQPCLCDARPEHFLFTGDRVTGVVDFGSCKLDHVAVDLARLLSDHRDLWTVGLDAYREERPLAFAERALADALERTGVVIAAANWLRWLYRDRRSYPNRAIVAARLAKLVQRMSAG